MLEFAIAIAAIISCGVVFSCVAAVVSKCVMFGPPTPITLPAAVVSVAIGIYVIVRIVALAVAICSVQ